MNSIDSFTGKFRFLSNFWPAKVTMDGVCFPTVEHAYQAAKTLSPRLRKIILEAETPGKTKRIAREFKIRDDWEQVKLSIMTDLVRQKFTIPELRDMLISTGDLLLVEGNSWNDIFWGVCRGVGENHLGRILMKIRAEILNK